MNTKRILGLVILAAGIICICVSKYIETQVLEGREEISSAQSKVDTANRVFSLNPISKRVGEGLTNSAQRKIDAGSEEAEKYAAWAHTLQIGGIVLIIGGGLVFFILGSRKRR